jgi:RHH-type proline utilization regulon transcriptional repressor/proline dehydrogenase/delta 1-pyrroline-5-carboxylate dehydrogenase
MGDALEADMDRLVALLSREAGKTLNDGVAEVREAADFCRYYAMLAERQFGGRETLKGPAGETNELVLHGRGVFACISRGISRWPSSPARSPPPWPPATPSSPSRPNRRP